MELLSEEQRSALLKTAVLLETDGIKHSSKRPMEAVEPPNIRELVGKPYEDRKDALAFNMFTWDCGTVVCIGGLSAAIARNSKLWDIVDIHQTPELHKLFYVTELNDGFNLARITPTQAARAIRNYLETGTAKWPEIMEHEVMCQAIETAAWGIAFPLDVRELAPTIIQVVKAAGYDLVRRSGSAGAGGGTRDAVPCVPGRDLV